MKTFSNRISIILFVMLALPGCAELRARSHARDGNRLYIEGDYEHAAKEYAVAEALLPTLSVITFNHGLACRQLMIPGAKTAENDAAVRCALDAFSRLQKSRPDDPRGKQLYLQTLFDADRFDELIAHYQSEAKKNPQNLEAINALIQIYSRREQWEESLQWTQRRGDVAQHDAEAQYSIGVFIWNRLFQKGGRGPRATYNPKPEANQTPPLPFEEGDIVGAERIRLADLGISYLEKALALRPTYREAMTYLNLLYRQRSYALFDQPDQWQAAVDQALEWQKKAKELGASNHNGTPNGAPN